MRPVSRPTRSRSTPQREPADSCAAFRMWTQCSAPRKSRCRTPRRSPTGLSPCANGWSGAWPMLALELQPSCRLSGEPLRDARVLAEVPSCPLPGVYPSTREQAADLRSPLRVVQARESGFVQLAHRLDTAVYEQYVFAGDTSGAYRRHLVWFADQVAAGFPSDTSILEIGCGDGLLLSLLEQRGMADRLGIDPGRAADGSDRTDVICGYFPGDLPRTARDRCFGLIVLRHVLEHIERPREFVAAVGARLAPGGELWIEVPDLDSTISAELWTNFYQLHCNYFTSGTLDRLAGEAGLACVDGRVVDVFGGSLLRRYRAGRPAPWAKPAVLGDVPARFGAFAARLEHLAEQLPDGVVGYGAAE